jgi:subtilase family serine protease
LPACSTSSPPPSVKQQASAKPDWATADNLIARIPATDPMTIQVHLRLRNEAQADAELAAMSDPKSAQFGSALTDAQFEALHAPSLADVQAVRKHLEANGLTVTYVPNNRAFVAAKGTAAQVEAAFKTELSYYNVGGETRHAASAAAVMPSHLADKVLTVAGLTTTSKFVPHDVHRGVIRRADLAAKAQHPSDVPGNICSEWYGKVADIVDPVLPGYPPLTYAPCGYRPGQLRDAYGFAQTVRSGTDGTGQTVAIVDAFLSPTLVQDASTYAFNNDSDYPLADGQLTTMWAPGQTQTPDVGWYSEQTLDVEAVHATAPGAKIIAVAAQSPTDQDLVAAINLIVDKKLANIISNSYGEVEGAGNNYVLWNHILKIAALKGVGVYFSSGDNGDNSQSPFGRFNPAADFPASSDLVTAVGGTSLALGPTGAPVFESGWESGFSFLTGSPVDGGVGGPLFWSPEPPGFFFGGSGGGTSFVYDQPAWQKGIVPDALANIPGAPARVVPDVAMLADPTTGFLIGQSDPFSGNPSTYTEFVIGGTSLAAPLFAGVVAVAQQNAKKAFGFANARYYAASKKGGFRDIAPLATPQAVALPFGLVIYFDYSGLTIHTAVGYDNVTGLGVPNGKKFLAAVK